MGGEDKKSRYTPKSQPNPEANPEPIPIMSLRDKLIKERVKKYEQLQLRIFEYSEQYSLHEIVTDMLNEAFLKLDPNPYQFMVEYLLKINSQNLEPPPINQPENLQNKCAQRQKEVNQHRSACGSENVSLPVNTDQPSTSRAFDSLSDDNSNTTPTDPVPRDTLPSGPRDILKSVSSNTLLSDPMNSIPSDSRTPLKYYQQWEDRFSNANKEDLNTESNQTLSEDDNSPSNVDITDEQNELQFDMDLVKPSDANIGDD